MFTPDSDAARIHIIDYDDNCESNVSGLSISGVLSLKTDDGRMNSSWNVHLSSILGGIPSISIGLNIEPQDLQGLPEPLEGAVPVVEG